LLIFRGGQPSSIGFGFVPECTVTRLSVVQPYICMQFAPSVPPITGVVLAVFVNLFVSLTVT